MTVRSTVAVARETGARPVPSRRETNTVAAQVWDALSRNQRELPADFLNDPAIAPVRRQVAQLDQRLPQIVERDLVRQSLAAFAATPYPRSLVELLPSTSDGILEVARTYPVDAYIALDSALAPAIEAVARFRSVNPLATTATVVTDPIMSLNLGRVLPRPAIFACLGGVLGRLQTLSVIRFLRAIRAAMSLSDRLLLGIDLRAGASIETDRRSATSLRENLHRHALAVVNRECDANFDPTRFHYYARYDEAHKRLDMGLECAAPSVVRLANMKSIALPAGSTIRTGVHCTYDRRSLRGMLLGVGLILDTWHEDERGEYAVAAVSGVQFDVRR